MKLSKFGHQLSSESGIVNLMEDLGEAINVNPDILFMGGGNPAQIPGFEKTIAKHLKKIADNPKALHKLIGTYQSPRGSEELIDALVNYFNHECGWPINKRNIAMANGSQSAFFILLNMFAGNTEAVSGNIKSTIDKKICFPLMPEYLGYSDQGLMGNLAQGCKPLIDVDESHFFKYRLDESAVSAVENPAAFCVSRPTNPSGNVLKDSEMLSLAHIAEEKDSWLLVDCAYGNPFPGIVYEEVGNFWHERAITVLSLSKLGLPGARTGIVIAEEEVINKFCQINTIISLANGNLGPALLTELINSRELATVCNTVIRDYYAKQRAFALQALAKHFEGISYKVHRAEGAFFLWLWFEDLAISSQELYEKLKARSVIIMPGEHFFFGLSENWDHSKQCVRISYCQDLQVLDRAIEIMAEELRKL